MDKKNYKEKILVYIGEDMPKISILIPIYNVEKYLQDCLESVIHQTERDIEIICVDDASVDGSFGRALQSRVDCKKICRFLFCSTAKYNSGFWRIWSFFVLFD